MDFVFADNESRFYLGGP